MADAAGYFQFLSRASAKLARRLGNFTDNPDIIAGIAADRIFERGLQILIANASQAVLSSPQYKDPILAGQLISVFSNPAMLSFSRQGVRIRAMELAGDWQDLFEGIEAARNEISLARGDSEFAYSPLSPGRAALFWRERIYRPAREGLKRPQFFKMNVGERRRKTAYDYANYGKIHYEATIETRMKYWGDMAPYWLFIEFGSTSAFSYPHQQPTHFVSRSETQISALYQAEIITVGQELANAVDAEIAAFLQNPQGYEPGAFLARVERTGAAFLISVSPTGELSIRRE